MANVQKIAGDAGSVPAELKKTGGLTTVVNATAGGVVGGVSGASIGGVVGGTIGAILGSIIPGAGTVAGGLLGAEIGAWAGGITGTLGGVYVGGNLNGGHSKDIKANQNRLRSAGHSGVYVFPSELKTDGDAVGLYKSYLHLSAVETTRAQLAAAAVSSLYGHEGSTSESNDIHNIDIFLPMPEDLDQNYSHSYNPGEVSSMEVAASETIAGSALNGIIGAGKRMVTSAAVTAEKVFSSTYDGLHVGQNVTNTTNNVKQSLSFTQTELRTYSAAWEFFPKSEDEVQMIDWIIDAIKFYSAPDGRLNDEFLTIPSKWILEEVNPDNKRISKLFHFGPAVIDSINVKRDLKSQFHTGDANSISLTLAFTETFSLYRNDIIGFNAEGQFAEANEAVQSLDSSGKPFTGF